MQARTARSVGTLAALCAVVASHATAQGCDFATVTSFDCNAPNPVTIGTGGDLPELGSQFTVQVESGPAGLLGLLGFTLAGTTCFPLGGNFNGDLLLNPVVPIELVSDAGTGTWVLPVPSDASLAGTLVYFQAGVLTGSSIELSNGLETTIGLLQADLWVQSIGVANDLVGGSGTTTVDVDVANLGNVEQVGQVQVDFGGEVGTAFFGPVAPGGSELVSVDVPIPNFAGGTTCDSSVTMAFDVTASLTGSDCDPSNDSLTVSRTVLYGYWDLEFTFISAPSSTISPGFLGWNVSIRNAGNIAAPPVDCRTALTPFGGSGNYVGVVIDRPFTTPALDPSQTWTYSASGSIPSSANGPHWLKAEPQPGNDPCTNLSSYYERPIQIF